MRSRATLVVAVAVRLWAAAASRLVNALRRIRLEEHGWSRVWVSLGMAITMAGGGLIYYQTTGGDCAYPTCFPSESNTGVPSGTNLTAYTGANPITTNDTVIDSKTITGCPLVIQASGVIIRNSEIVCSNETALGIDDNSGNYTLSNSGTEYLVTVEDSLIDCGPIGSASPTGVVEAHFHLVRVEVKRCENGLSINQNALIEDSLVWKHDNSGVDPHEDAIQFSQGHWDGTGFYTCTLDNSERSCTINVTIRHNTLIGMAETGEGNFTTSAIISNKDDTLQPDPDDCAGCTDENILIEKNLMVGGGYTIYCVQSNTGINYQVINNHWSTQYFPNVGYLNHSTDCSDETESGNVIHETGTPITLE